jgi:hypothetical protein
MQYKVVDACGAGACAGVLFFMLQSGAMPSLITVQSDL